MMPGSPISTAERPSDREVVFRRLLDAPRELVWKVWSDPEHLHHWFGPAGFTLTTLEFVVVVTLLPEGKRTRFSIHITFRDAAAMKTAVELYGVLQGGTQTLDRLAQYLARAG